MNKSWQWFLPGYVWSASNTLIGLIVALIWYRGKRWRLSQGCIECLSDRLQRSRFAAVTLGNVVIYANEEIRGMREVRVHERVHVAQGFVWGPFHPLAYGLEFARHYLGGKGYMAAYRANRFEREAYAVDHRTDAWGS